MHAFDRQTDRRTDGRTDRQTDRNLIARPRCIPCSAVKNVMPLNRSTSNMIKVITSGTSAHKQTLVFLSLTGSGSTYAWNRHHPCLFFTALHGMQTRSSNENSVCLSVRLSVKRVHCDKTEEKSVQIFIPCERSFSLVFWEEEWLVGATRPTWNFGSIEPRWNEIADFQPIIAPSASAVTQNEKSSINTNRKSTTRFPMSLRWSASIRCP